jgi:uncharacterized Zn-binding protein involved in type VI secretion
MPGFISRVTDTNEVGGQIVRGAVSVLAEGLPVGLHPSPITPHLGSPKPLHAAATTTMGSPTVFVEGFPVLRVTSPTTCGHTIIRGATSIIVP